MDDVHLIDLTRGIVVEGQLWKKEGEPYYDRLCRFGTGKGLFCKSNTVAVMGLRPTCSRIKHSW